MDKKVTAWLNESTGDIHSPKGRLIWSALFEPKANPKFPNKKPTFQANLLIPKTCDIVAIQKEIERAAVGAFGAKWKEKSLKLPLKKTIKNDKLEFLAEEFPWLLSASANVDFAPIVLGPDAKVFKGNASDHYDGRWGIIAGSAWSYTTGSDGIGWNLNRCQLLDHDEVLPVRKGRSTSTEGFDTYDVGGSAPASGEAATADDMWK